LAKALDDAGQSSPEGDPMNSLSPTMTIGATQAGVILGTAAYMAPEQAKGKRADRKADIWSFGVVLHEMLTGKRVFAGETMAETLASVMKEQLTFDDLPAETPAPLRKLVKRCLERDLKRRVQSMGEARIAIEDILSGAATEEVKVVTQPTPAKPSILPWALAGAAILVAAVALWAPWKTPPAAPDVVRLEIPAPDKTNFNNALILSPDGRHLVFTTNGEGGNTIWVRDLDTLQARKLAPWSQNPVPFWSPDSRFVAFQQDGKLKKVDIAGGPPVTLCDAPQAFAGGAWNQDGVIIFGSRNGALMQVSAAGGVPTPVTKLDERHQESTHALPSFFPDGKHFVYLRRSSNAEFSGIYVGELGVQPEKQDAKPLLLNNTAAVYTPAPDPRDATRGLGFLLFLRESTLMAQPFDAAARALKGEPRPIAEQIGTTNYGLGKFTVSDNGSLAYSSGSDTSGGSASRLTWFDRKGKNLGNVGEPGTYRSLALSPDGSRVAVQQLSGGSSDLWLVDTAPGGKADRFTFTPGNEAAPVWSPDGAQIIFAADGGTPVSSFFQKPSNLAGNEVEIFRSGDQKLPTDWSRDGKTLLYFALTSANPDLWSLPLGDKAAKEADKKPEVFLKTDATERHGKLSPDGRWIAYNSNATGRYEIYVRPFPNSPERTGQWMVSNSGGVEPLWRRDGKELFYQRPASGTTPAAWMSVDVTPGPVFKAGTPKELFPITFAPTNGSSPAGWDVDVSPDGQRFLWSVVGTTGAGTPQAPMRVVLNWTSGLK
jgi:Tol biopolymer transport system component